MSECFLLEPSIAHETPEVKKNFKKNHNKKKEILADKGFMLPSLHIENISIGRLSTVQTLDTSFTMLFHWLKRMPRRKVRLLDCIYKFVLNGVHSVNQEKLSMVSGIPVRTVQRYLKEFQDCGLITKITFYKLQNVYIIPTIVYMKRFARRMTRYLTSCKEWLKKQALNIKLLVPKKTSKEYSGGHIRKILLKESYFIKTEPLPELLVRKTVPVTELKTECVRTRATTKSARTKKENYFRKRDSLMDMNIREHFNETIVEIAHYLRLTPLGCCRLEAFTEPQLKEIWKQYKASVAKEFSPPVEKPIGYLWSIGRNLGYTPDDVRVGSVQVSLGIDPRLPFTDNYNPAAVAEQIRALKTSGDVQASSTNRSQSRSKSHISPTVPNNLKQPSSVGYTRQPNKPAKIAPGLHELPGGTPLMKAPSGEIHRQIAKGFFDVLAKNNPEFAQMEEKFMGDLDIEIAKNYSTDPEIVGV